MSRQRSIIIPSMALLVAAGAMPAAGQSRVEVTTTRRGAAAGESDSAFRRLQRTLDSLTQRYNEGEVLTAAYRRRIEGQLSQTVERLAVLMSRMNDEVKPRIMLRAPQAIVMPSGWIGIVAEGPGMQPRVENGEMVVRYLSYPRIVSVDPSSPAQAAGIIPNDTLVAYDGMDVRENDIYLNRLLRPNTRISVRLRRDGRFREVPVVVAEAPSRIVQRRGDEVRDERSIAIAVSPEAPGLPRMPMPAPMARGGARLAPTPAMAPQTMVFSFTAGGVAGAQLVTITEGLGKRLGVSNGVLVTRVPVGTPASESGLEDGDVIVRAAGQLVREVLDVRRAVGAASENGQHSVDLELLRDSKTVRASLRW